MSRRCRRTPRARPGRSDPLSQETQRDAVPPRIPGVRIACIGVPTGVLEQLRSYWEGRGAVFLHCDLLDRRHQSNLERILSLADIVFLSESYVKPELMRRLEVYCERMEKPLVPLDELPAWMFMRDRDVTTLLA